jgi:hypothetical protein
MPASVRVDPVHVIEFAAYQALRDKAAGLERCAFQAQEMAKEMSVRIERLEAEVARVQAAFLEHTKFNTRLINEKESLEIALDQSRELSQGRETRIERLEAALKMFMKDWDEGNSLKHAHRAASEALKDPGKGGGV